MGEIKTVQTPKRDVAAQAALADDYLCPDAERPWARLYWAITRWIAGDSKRSVNKLAETAHVSRTAITGTMKENAKRKTDDEGLTRIAQVVGVSPTWLIKGYDLHSDQWLLDRQEHTKAAAAFITKIFDAYLYRCARVKPTLSIVQKIVGLSSNEYPVDDSLMDMQPLVGGDDPDYDRRAAGLVTRCIARDQITLNDYLSRYHRIVHSWGSP